MGQQADLDRQPSVSFAPGARRKAVDEFAWEDQHRPGDTRGRKPSHQMCGDLEGRIGDDGIEALRKIDVDEVLRDDPYLLGCLGTQRLQHPCIDLDRIDATRRPYDASDGPHECATTRTGIEHPFSRPQPRSVDDPSDRRVIREQVLSEVGLWGDHGRPNPLPALNPATGTLIYGRSWMSCPGMFHLVHQRDLSYLDHLEEARRVLALPIDANGLEWHPFGTYAVPLARRVDGDEAWVRRLHLWHPETTPVGETSIYGVHTHSGLASSHVLVGTLQHHLYAFEPAEDGAWREASRDGTAYAQLTAHLQGPTIAGTTHTFPAHQAHGVSKPPGYAISLFEQREEPRTKPFTTWQRLDGPEEGLLEHAPIDPVRVLREARVLVEEALYRSA